MEMKGNTVTFPKLCRLHPLQNIYVRYIVVTQVTVPLGTKVGRSPPSHFSAAYTCPPIGRTVVYAPGTGSYLKVTPLDGSLSPRSTQIGRALMLSPLRANFQSIFQPSNQSHSAQPFSIENTKAEAADTLSRPWR